jgi:hypothetical protein
MSFLKNLGILLSLFFFFCSLNEYVNNLKTHAVGKGQITKVVSDDLGIHLWNHLNRI